MPDRIAIIDMGSNTFHLLIAEWKDKRFHFIHQEKHAVKIAAGGINDGVIHEEAIVRATGTLKRFAQTIDKFQVKKVKAFATSALRSARNQQNIIQRFHDETGIAVQIISGDQEADYIYQGVRSAISLGSEKSLIIDIGGGSVEFIIANKSGIFWMRSYDIGGQRLLEKFHKHDPILQSEIETLNIFFTQTLQELQQELRVHDPKTLVGSSGSFDTLSEMYCVNHGLIYNSDDPETPLTFTSFNETYTQLIAKNRKERMELAGMIDMRVDMIVVACCLIRFILDHHNFNSIRVSSYSLKEGVLATLKK